MKSQIKEKIHQIEIKRIENIYEKNIKQSMQLCPMKPLTKGQEADIKAYFKKYFGREVPTYWHQYLYSRNGVYSEKYIPASIYNSEIIYRLNKFQFRHAYVDKGFYDTLFPDINRPKTVIKNVNGYYYDDHNALTLEEAIEKCSNLNEAIIKPTLEGTWGQGVKLIRTENGMIPSLNCSIQDLFKEYKRSFIIQERFEQHEDIAKLNPTSLNTLRVMSYRRENEIVILYAVIRIGRMNQVIDNETAGGIKADIDLQTGRIKGVAFGSPKEPLMPKTDVGTVLDGYQMPCFQKVLDLVKEMHLRLPYFNLIGWDMSVDKNGNPALIEWNRAAELSQVAHGPAFGEYTEEILSVVKNRVNSRFEVSTL
ncbi:MAG: hypothetical protein IKZ56_05435 [Bacteroidales bacterium]|nr:hypothetical protein [Bacteroidales bacterium]